MSKRRSSVPSSATSPDARSRASGMVGWPSTREHDRQAFRASGHELARDQPDVRRLVDEMEVVQDEDRTVLGDRRQLAKEDIDDRVARRPADRHVLEHRRRRRREPGIVLAPGRDEVVQEGDPVPVVLVEAVPERAQAGSLREVGEQRRLAVAGIREHEDDPVVDLGGQPIEQPAACERVVAQRTDAGPWTAGSGIASRPRPDPRSALTRLRPLVLGLRRPAPTRRPISARGAE